MTLHGFMFVKEITFPVLFSTDVIVTALHSLQVSTSPAAHTTGTHTDTDRHTPPSSEKSSPVFKNDLLPQGSDVYCPKTLGLWLWSFLTFFPILNVSICYKGTVGWTSQFSSFPWRGDIGFFFLLQNTRNCMDFCHNSLKMSAWTSWGAVIPRGTLFESPFPLTRTTPGFRFWVLVVLCLVFWVLFLYLFIHIMC